jgi:hypothetical protein
MVAMENIGNLADYRKDISSHSVLKADVAK